MMRGYTQNQDKIGTGEYIKLSFFFAYSISARFAADAENADFLGQKFLTKVSERFLKVSISF